MSLLLKEDCQYMKKFFLLGLVWKLVHKGFPLHFCFLKGFLFFEAFHFVGKSLMILLLILRFVVNLALLMSFNYIKGADLF